jgi:hypothetical protein
LAAAAARDGGGVVGYRDGGGQGARGHGGAGTMKKGRSSFLKKSSKRLLFVGVYARRATYAKVQKFFGSFFQKRTLASSFAAA